jgi:hypothetical protein
VSEKSITWQQAGLVRQAKRAAATPLISLGTALVANSLCPGQEKRKMCDLELQIGNSGFIVCNIFRRFWVTKRRALVRKYFHS